MWGVMRVRLGRYCAPEPHRRKRPASLPAPLPAVAAVARVKGAERYPALLVETCCAIADADGGFDAEERTAAIRICEVLGLDPGDFGLADAR